MVAKIAVSAATYAIDKPYSYRVPEGMAVEPGMRVTVPFGRGNRRCEGVVLSLEAVESGELKTVEQRHWYDHVVVNGQVATCAEEILNIIADAADKN